MQIAHADSRPSPNSPESRETRRLFNLYGRSSLSTLVCGRGLGVVDYHDGYLCGLRLEFQAELLLHRSDQRWAIGISGWWIRFGQTSLFHVLRFAGIGRPVQRVRIGALEPRLVDHGLSQTHGKLLNEKFDGRSRGTQVSWSHAHHSHPSGWLKFRAARVDHKVVYRKSLKLSVRRQLKLTGEKRLQHSLVVEVLVIVHPLLHRGDELRIEFGVHIEPRRLEPVRASGNLRILDVVGVLYQPFQRDSPGAETTVPEREHGLEVVRFVAARLFGPDRHRREHWSSRACVCRLGLTRGRVEQANGYGNGNRQDSGGHEQ